MNLITLTDPRSPAAEAYRSLRTTLMFQSVERPITTLLVTSAVQADQKSTTLANLAVTFAQGGYKTIIVETDLWRPMQHEIWGIPNDRGLTTMVLEDSALANPPLVNTSVDNLQVLPSGPLPPIPADVISSKRMGEILGLLKARANYVLFDAPPILAVTDSVLLSTRVDGVLLVTQSGQTRREDVARAKQALERVHARLVGAVLGNAPRESAGRYYGK